MEKTMFEKYTEKARKVVFFARYEASQFGASEIKSEHLLMGLIREDKELINKVFKGSENLIDLDFVHKEVETRTHKLRGIEPYTYDLELSLEVKRILACASEEYEKLQSKYLSTEHLLLGILGIEETCVASEILRGQGLSFDSVRDRIKFNINSISSSTKEELDKDDIIENEHNISSKLKLVEILKDLKQEIAVLLIILLIMGLMKETAILVGTDLDKFVGEQGINSLRIYVVGSLFTQIMLFEAKALKWKLLSLLIQSSMFGVIVSLNCCGDIWQSSLSNTLKVLICIWSMCWVSFYISFRLVLPIGKLITSKTL
jgi:hypothetical protein